MKKYLIGIILLMASIMALTACGEPPLENACNDLNAITPAAQTDEESSELAEAVTSGVAAEYDAEKDQLVIGITGGAELDPIFETLNKDIADQEVGTIIFLLDGTLGNGYENDLDQKISELSCTSMEKLGLNYPILDAETHNWTGLSAKTDKLYIDSPPSVFETYTDTDKQNLAGFTEVEIVYQEAFRYAGINKLAGVKTVSFVPGIAVPEPPAPADESAEATEATEETEATEAADSSEEGDEPAFAPMTFTYSKSMAQNVEDIAKMKSLETILIYPETGYTMDSWGQDFIVDMQCLKPTLKINPPDEAWTGENLVAVTDVETPDISQEQKDRALADFLKPKIQKVYNKCKKFKTVDKNAVLAGPCLIYDADPDTDDWGSSRAYSSTGTVLINEAPKKIKVPKHVKDYNTFVYIYPTYTRTGSYNTGTIAYRQTLHVQVFDLGRKAAYEAETVGTAEAPQKFTYFVGSMPDKKSGEVSMKNVWKYLKKLKKTDAQ